MPKLCDYKGCYNNRFGGGYCKNHQYMRPGKSKVSFDPVAAKRRSEYLIYKPRKKKYLMEHPICEVYECKSGSHDLHHKNGRTGKMLYNVDYFFAACRDCHIKIHENPKWAREEGYLI